MKRLTLALVLFGTALGANAALILRGAPQAEGVGGTSRIDLGGHQLTVTRALIRDRAQMAGGRLDRLDLAVSVVDFAPLSADREPDETTPERLSIILTASGTAPDPAEMFQGIYARFLARETWSNPGGLVMRRFQAGTPYEGRELYIGAGGKRVFVALCPQDSQREIEPCTTTLRQGGIDAELRFSAAHLPDWRRIVASAQALIAGAGKPGHQGPGSDAQSRSVSRIAISKK